MRALSAVVVLLLSAAGTSVLAQRAAPVTGPPAVSCGSYTETRMLEGSLGPESIQFFSWVQGYFSAYNHYAKHPIVEVPDYTVIRKHLDKYCLDNPMHRVANGVDSLLAELGGYKQPYLGK